MGAVPSHQCDRYITCVPASEGRLYLTVVLDPSTRQILGWAMRDHMPNGIDYRRPDYGYSVSFGRDAPTRLLDSE
jgi:transposase InsO family protein